MEHCVAIRYDRSAGNRSAVGSGLVAWLVGLTLLALAASFAKGAVAAPSPAGEPLAFAEVFRLEGQVTASGPSGLRTLKLGDTVLVGERLVASSSGEGVLKTRDGGYVAIRPGAEFMAERFAAEGKPTDRSQLNLFKGALRIISGWIGKINRQGSRVSTTTATIGIRGTDHEPYVLLDDDPDVTRFKPGTYDKVNQGGTTLQAAGQSVDIDPGKVGFARSPGKSRALMTLLFPVLLDKVPDFYVPGKFDAELDELSKNAQANNEAELQLHRKQAASCAPAAVAKQWIEQLDQHIVDAQADAIGAMFAQDVRVKAAVRGANGKMTELELERADFADSVVAAVSSLRDYKHRRVTIKGKPVDSAAPACSPIQVVSVVIEQGRQAGKPYRFESEERFVLKQVEGRWLAVEAQTRQR